MDRQAEIESEVRAKLRGWDYYDQGRWSHAHGFARQDNPFTAFTPCFAGRAAEWAAGWDAEAKRAEERRCSECHFLMRPYEESPRKPGVCKVCVQGYVSFGRTPLVERIAIERARWS